MSLLSLTVRWIDSHFDLKVTVLHHHQFRGSHTAEHVKQANEEMLNTREIDRSVLFCGVMQEIHKKQWMIWWYQRWAASYKLQHASAGCTRGSAFFSITDTLPDTRKIVGHFRHLPQAYARLEDIQIDMKMPPKRLQQDVQVRWNSAHYMIQSIVEEKAAFSAFSMQLSTTFLLH